MDTENRNLNPTWACPNCETKNYGQKCVVCGTSRPLKQRSSSRNIPNRNSISFQGTYSGVSVKGHKQAEKPKRLNVILSSALTCALLLTIILIAVFHGEPQDKQANVSTENDSSVPAAITQSQLLVPKLDSLSKEEAIAVLSKTGIQNYSFEYEYSETVPEGVICRQSANEGTQLSDTEALLVFVSKGSEYVIVPDVMKKTKSEAEKIIAALQLEFEFQYEQCDEVEKDYVFRQSIPGGANVKIGSTIVLDVCSDRLTIPVPNVVGQSKANANSSLAGQGFMVNFAEEYHDIVSEGCVISQMPLANSFQEKGTYINIVLSKGPKPVETVPPTTEPSPISITVSFNPVGGYVGTSSKTVTVSSKYGNLPIPSKDTYSFDGWYTSEAGGSYIDSSTIVSSASSHTLYAHWSSNRYSDWVSDLPSDVLNNRSSYHIEERVEYQSRVRSTITSNSSELAGWTRISSDRTGWSDWSSWQTSPIYASTGREVNTQTIPAITKTVYCYDRWYGRNSPNDYYYSSYGNGVWKNHETYECDSPLPKDHVTDGYQCYKGPGGSINNPYWWNETTKTVEVSPAYTQYQYRDAIYTYTFEQWGNWSSWQTTPISGDGNTQVQTRTLYRYVQK